MDLYDRIDKESKYNCEMYFKNLANEYNAGDIIIKNFIANNMFNFLLSIIVDDNFKQTLINVYEGLDEIE